MSRVTPAPSGEGRHCPGNCHRRTVLPPPSDRSPSVTREPFQLELRAEIIVRARYALEPSAWPPSWTAEEVCIAVAELYRHDPAALLEAFVPELVSVTADVVA